MPSSQAISPESAAPKPGPKHEKRDRPAVIDCSIKEVFYGAFKAVRDTSFQSKRTRLQVLLDHRVVARVTYCAA